MLLSFSICTIVKHFLDFLLQNSKFDLLWSLLWKHWSFRIARVKSWITIENDKKIHKTLATLISAGFFFFFLPFPWMLETWPLRPAWCQLMILYNVEREWEYRSVNIKKYYTSARVFKYLLLLYQLVSDSARSCHIVP